MALRFAFAFAFPDLYSERKLPFRIIELLESRFGVRIVYSSVVSTAIA